MPRRNDPSDRPLTPAESRELQREFAADEHAARVRDFGQADAATHEHRMAEASKLREAAAPTPPEAPPATLKELEPVLQELEKGWRAESKPFDVADYARSSPPVEKDRGPER